MKIENSAEKAEVLVAIVHSMDRDVLAKNYTRFMAAARGLEPKHYGRGVVIALMRAQARLGMYDEAWDTLQTFQEQWLKDRLLNYIIEQQAKAGRYDAALGMIAMFDMDWKKCGATAIVAGAMAEAGEYEQAVKLAKTIKEQYSQSRAFVLIGKAYFAKGDIVACKKNFDIAAKLARDAERAREDLLCEVAMAQTEAGLWEDAWGIVQTTKRGRDRSEIIKKILQESNKAGKFYLSMQIARASTSDARRAKCLADVAVAQARAGQRAAAEKTFAEATALYRNAKYSRPASKALSLAALARARGLAGMNKEAAKIFAEAVEIARKIEPEHTRDYYLKCVMKVQAEAGMFDEALATARKFKEATVRVRLLKTIGEMQVKAGKIDEAEKTAAEVEKAAEEIKNNPKQYLYSSAKQSVSHIYLHIARAKIEAGALDKALEYLPKFTEGYYSGRLIIDVAQYYARAGKFDEAAKTYRRALEEIYAGEYRHLGGLLADIVKGYAELGMFTHAMVVTQRMQHASSQAPLMALIGERMAVSARTEAVVGQYKRIKNEHAMPRAWYCIGVARGLAQPQQAAKSKS